MICPKCGGEQLCPCKNCKNKNSGMVVWVYITGEDIMCGHCGYVSSGNVWFDEDMRQYEAKKAHKANP